MTRIIQTAVLWFAIVAAAVGQDLKPIEVVGPTSPIGKSAAIFIPVNNLDEDEFLASTITVTPKKGAVAFRVYGAPLIIFQGNEPGKYTVSIGRNVQHIEWQKALAESVTYAKSAKAPADFILKLENLHDDALSQFPSRGGSCVVEVAGAVVVPTDPTDPLTPPVDPSLKPTQVTYIWEKDQNSVPRPVSLALRKLNEQGILATEFEEDSTVDGTPGGRVPSQYVVALKAARDAGLPALVVQSGATVLRVVKAPATEEQVMEASK